MRRARQAEEGGDEQPERRQRPRLMPQGTAPVQGCLAALLQLLATAATDTVFVALGDSCIIFVLTYWFCD